MSSPDSPLIPAHSVSGMKRRSSYLEEQSSDNEESLCISLRIPEAPFSNHDELHSYKNPFGDDEEPDSEMNEHAQNSNIHRHERGIETLERLLQTKKTSPEESDLDLSIDDLEKIIHTIRTNSQGLDRYQDSISESTLYYTIIKASNEKVLEGMAGAVIEAAKSKMEPENEHAANILSCFRGPTADAEGEKLLAAIIAEMDFIEELDDIDCFKDCAEPFVLDGLMRWRDKETRQGLKTSLNYSNEHC